MIYITGTGNAKPKYSMNTTTMPNHHHHHHQQQQIRRWRRLRSRQRRRTITSVTVMATPDSVVAITMMMILLLLLNFFSWSCHSFSTVTSSRYPSFDLRYQNPLFAPTLTHTTTEIEKFDRQHHQQQLPLKSRRRSLLNVILRSNDGSGSDNTGSGSSRNNSDDDGDDDDDDDGGIVFDMSALKSRMAELSERENKLPLVVLDAMLPRQVLSLNVQNELLMELVRDCLRREEPYVGMLGLARLSSGQTIHLARGVEVEIVTDKTTTSSGSPPSTTTVASTAATSNPNGGFNVSFKARRRFKVVEGGVEQAYVSGVGRKGWTEGRVEFLDSEQEESDETKNGDDPSSIVRAVTKAKEFTSPNMNTPNNMSLVERWIVLAKDNERQPRQIEDLLAQLGEIPPSSQPSERAFWVGALINPLPALGVALEIRPALLTAKTAEQRVEIALDGIFKSIKHMEGSQRLW